MRGNKRSRAQPATSAPAHLEPDCCAALLHGFHGVLYLEDAALGAPSGDVGVILQREGDRGGGGMAAALSGPGLPNLAGCIEEIVLGTKPEAQNGRSTGQPPDLVAKHPAGRKKAVPA